MNFPEARQNFKDPADQSYSFTLRIGAKYVDKEKSIFRIRE